MNKWLNTYLLIVCCFCFHTAGFANSINDSRTRLIIKCATSIPGALSSKKAGIALPGHLADYGNDILFLNHGMGSSHSVKSYFLALPFFFVAISRRPTEEVPIKNKVEKVLKDYLRHLFPSHYFW